MQKNSKVSTK